MFTDGFRKCDTHMHPDLLNRPQQAEDFIRAAIAGGFDMICFTDHIWHPRSDAADRMPENSVERYCDAVRALAGKYRGVITLLCGIEVDYHPQDEPFIRELLSHGSFDHIIGSSHIPAEMYDLPLHRMTKDQLAEVSLENSLRAAESGLFDTIAHLDQYRCAFAAPEKFPLLHSVYHAQEQLPLIRRIFAAMERQGTALEINAAGIRKQLQLPEPHPEDSLLAASAAYRLHYVYASDAHIAADVGYSYKRCMAGIPQRGITA